MRIPITCDSCGRDFSAPDSHVGRKVVCPDCGTGVKVRSSGIIPTRKSDEDSSRSGTHRARGAGPNPKIILGILGIVAVLAGAAVAIKNLPDLSQMNSVVVSSPPPVANVPPAAAGIGPGAAPAESKTIKVAEPAPEKGDDQPEENSRQPKAPASTPTLGISGTPEGQKKRNRRQAADRNQNSVVTGDRSQPQDEADTDRGQQMLGQLKSVVMVLESGKKASFDPRGALSKRVADRTKTALEKAGLKVYLSSPRQKAAVLTWRVSGKPSPVGTPGTQEITLFGELVCFDPKAETQDAAYASVWKHEESLGTVGRNSLRAGKIPEKLDRNIGEFVSRFRVAWQQAAKAAPALEEGEESEDIAEQQMDSTAGESADENSNSDADPTMVGDEGAEDAEMDGEVEPGESVPEPEAEAETSTASEEATDETSVPKNSKASP